MGGGKGAGDPVELRHLRYFVAVADAGSVVQAARALNVAQPALSRQIQALERLVGVTLLERLPHGVRLTRAGRAFLADARRTLAAAQRAVTRARDGSAVASDRLRIAYAELLAHWRSVADVLHRFRIAYPMVELRAAQMTGPQMPAALREGRVDLAIVGVAKWPPRGLDGIRLIDATQTGALLPANHPIATAERIRIADLASLTWYHLPSEATLGCYEAAQAALRQRGLRAKHRTARAGSFAGLPQIAAGNAFAFADPTLGNLVSTSSSGIVYRPFTDAPVTIWLALLWKKGQRAKAALDFIDTARKVCRPGREGRTAG